MRCEVTKSHLNTIDSGPTKHNVERIITPPVVVLAGGLGTRLRPVTGSLPKALASLAPGMPMLRYVLSYWVARGARRFVLCLGHQATLVEEAIDAWSGSPLDIDIVTEHEPLGTGGAVLLALPVLPEEFFVINGDTVIDVSLGAVSRWHHAGNWDGTVVASARTVGDQADGLELSSTGALTAMRGRAERATWVYAGISLLRRSLFEGLSLATPASLEIDVFGQALRAGKRIGGARTRQPFHDLGTPERLLSFSSRLQDG